jgi:hypothetical protein
MLQHFLKCWTIFFSFLHFYNNLFRNVAIFFRFFYCFYLPEAGARRRACSEGRGHARRAKRTASGPGKLQSRRPWRSGAWSRRSGTRWRIGRPRQGRGSRGGPPGGGGAACVQTPGGGSAGEVEEDGLGFVVVGLVELLFGVLVGYSWLGKKLLQRI